MESGTNATTAQVRIVVSKDQLQAWVELPGSALPNFSPPGEQDIILALTEKGIELTDALRERVRQYVRIIGGSSADDAGEGRAEIPERFLVARGQAPVDAENGSFEWDDAFNERMQDWQGDAPVNYYTLNSILTIDADTTVGRLMPPTEGEVGKDVFGRELAPCRRKGLPLKLGSGLRTAENDPQQVVTEVPGRLVQEGSALCMQELLKIPGDLDFKFGNINSIVDVHICGSIKPNFSVKTAKSLTVERAVDAAELEVGGDLQVRGGIFGQESGRLVKAEGSITASICDAARVEAVGDICISKEIINSSLRTAGELRIERGSIIGGEIYARHGVKVKHAGSDIGVTTRIAVGTDGAVLYRAQQMDGQVKKHQEQVEQIRTRIQPLLANLKRLTPAQREQVTELMSKADEMETAASDLAAERQQLLEQAKPQRKPGVDVVGTLHSGVEIVFGLREARIKTPFKGPVRVEKRQVKGATEIVVVDRLTGSVIPLPSVAVDMARFDESRRTSGESDGAE